MVLVKISVLLLTDLLSEPLQRVLGLGHSLSLFAPPPQGGSQSLGVTVETFPSGTGDLRHGIVLVKIQM